jgi:hypothetical protein
MPGLLARIGVNLLPIEVLNPGAVLTKHLVKAKKVTLDYLQPALYPAVTQLVEKNSQQYCYGWDSDCHPKLRIFHRSSPGAYYLFYHYSFPFRAKNKCFGDSAKFVVSEDSQPPRVVCAEVICSAS